MRAHCRRSLARVSTGKSAGTLRASVVTSIAKAPPNSTHCPHSLRTHRRTLVRRAHLRGPSELDYRTTTGLRRSRVLTAVANRSQERASSGSAGALEAPTQLTPCPHSCRFASRLCWITEVRWFLSPVVRVQVPSETLSAVISGETMIDSANHASIRSLSANERRVRFPPLRPTFQGASGSRNDTAPRSLGLEELRLRIDLVAGSRALDVEAPNATVPRMGHDSANVVGRGSNPLGGTSRAVDARLPDL